MNYVVHLYEIFMKKGKIYMIHECFENTLVDLVAEEFPRVN
jgi:hypothetical protein